MIEWTDRTWNPVRGCSRVSEGCRNCYAERMAGRFSGPGSPFSGFAKDGKWTGKVELIPGKLGEPLKWRKPRRVFVNSMSDLFHEALPDAATDQVFATMIKCQRHTFQVLTKRPARMLAWVKSRDFHPAQVRNVWLGVSCEDQATADERIPLLLQTPAAVRFVSLEPLLGPIDLECVLWGAVGDSAGYFDRNGRERSRGIGGQQMTARPRNWLHWVIVGGESGPGARPCDVEWIRSIVGQCKAAEVPCFVKQLGEHHRPLDPKGGDLAEWPADLRVREFPR